MEKIKAVLFDMDGVLIDAKDWHYEALNKALALFGYEIMRTEHLSSYDGLPTSTKLKKLSIEKGLPEKLHDFINEMKQQYTVEIIHNQCRPHFNHEFALSKLKAEGYRIACCSNSIRMTIEMMMDHSKLKNYLEFIISNQDVKMPKPSPEIYLKAMEKMGLKPSECLIVEDNENGIKAALASGGHLMTVKDVNEVNYYNIKKRILEIEGGVK
ncbi:HAD family hydrolase [Pectobacterium carotovorum]|uniref:HAD family hydrolase n=1 Tax=Pectobacterium carotovorum TaxID=554 RepID=UPI000583F706|nr:HAD family phosphatase [Pectobacterium carotovorum]KHS82999.1 HAD family hydrolase [Pectobacterium carotovorum subsp. carotovorum]MCA6969027.1 HAD family phosphatase [Pectobacterium carotovorum]